MAKYDQKYFFHSYHKISITAAPRPPLLIAATLVNESAPTGRAAQRLSSGSRYLYVTLLFLTEPLLNCVKLNRADCTRKSDTESTK